MSLREILVTHSKRDEGQTYEIEILNKQDMPEWFTRDEVRFVIEPARMDRTYVFLPYERYVKGTLWRPHPKTLPRPKWAEPKKAVVSNNKTMINVGKGGQVNFMQRAKPLKRTWMSTDGKKLVAFLSRVEGDNATMIVGTKKHVIPIEKFTPNDQMRIRCWHASAGEKLILPAATLNYEFVRKKGSVELNIAYDGASTTVVTIPFYREYRYNHAKGLMAVYKLSASSKTLITVAKLKPLEIKQNPNLGQYGTDRIGKKQYTSWLHGDVNGYSTRFTEWSLSRGSGQQYRTKIYQANILAPAIAESLYYVLGGFRKLHYIPSKHRAGSFTNDNQFAARGWDGLGAIRELSHKDRTLPMQMSWKTYQNELETIRIVSMKEGAEVDFSLPAEALSLEAETIIRYIEGRPTVIE